MRQQTLASLSTRVSASSSCLGQQPQKEPPHPVSVDSVVYRIGDTFCPLLEQHTLGGR